jgi:hypothetical protein
MGADYHHFLMPSRDMHPRIRKGERVIFDKSDSPEVDDDVVIALADGSIVVRRLIDVTDECFTVGTYEPERADRLDRAAVANMWPVAWREAPDRYEQLRGDSSEGDATHAQRN